jgi:hypothetical protein
MQPYVLAKDLLAGMTIRWNEGHLGPRQKRALVIAVEYKRASRFVGEFIHFEETVHTTLLRENGTKTTAHMLPDSAVDQMAPIAVPKEVTNEDNG